MTEQSRKPHAVMDLPSRTLKAKKIERILDLPAAKSDWDLLEVGTGSGGIASYFANHGRQSFRVVSVDVVDSRVDAEGYRFVQVDSPALPFADESFDIVISNHVIEHVGDSAAQALHLRELRRVMRPRGIGYLAVPNRWMLVEPHYRLAFLSWLPKPLRSAYLSAFRGVPFYDCEPLALGELESMLAESGWAYNNRCEEAASAMLEIEPASLGLRLYRALPTWLRRATLPLMPTLIYRLIDNSSNN